MYKELMKYRTGGKITVVCDTVVIGKPITISLDEYKADLGDLLNDFIEHKSKPFWKRKYYHRHLTQVYMDMLNTISIAHGILT